VTPNPFQSLEKALKILELLAARAPQGVTEIAAQLGLEASGVSRLLKSLAGWGYVVAGDRRGQYRLGPRVLVLAERFLLGDRLVQEARPVLEALAEETRSSAHLGAAVGDRMLILAKAQSPERIQVATRVGGRIAPHASALGKMLLAGLSPKERAPYLAPALPRYTARTITDRRRLAQELETVRRQGYALEVGEEHEGVGCIGAPVCDAEGRWTAAISISGPLQGTPFRVDAAHRRALVERAGELSRRLGSGT
jgi:IclR family acetate operon transcriptional repressor